MLKLIASLLIEEGLHLSQILLVARGGEIQGESNGLAFGGGRDFHSGAPLGVEASEDAPHHPWHPLHIKAVSEFDGNP